jgi:hypothetical protein
MGRFAGFALFLGICSVVLAFVGAPFAIGALILVPVAALALLVIVFPGRESRGNVRVVALFALLFGALPLVKPWIDAFAFAQQEKLRARQTAPLFAKLKGDAAALAQQAETFRSLHGIYPAATGSTLEPMVGVDGRPLPADARFPATTPDPFDMTRALRVVPVGTKGFMVVSTGQDGVPDFPPLVQWSPIDPPGGEALAPFAYAGIEPQRMIFNLQSSPLAPGDAVEWFPSGGGETPTLSEVLAPLSEAWERVNRVSPWPDKFSSEKFPDPERELAAARQFLAEDDNLAAVCAAARCIMFRPEQPALVKTRGLADADKIRALALMRMGHVRLGADALIDYIALVPNDAEAHFHLGSAFQQSGAQELARRHFYAAIQAEPGSAWVAKAQAAMGN